MYIKAIASSLIAALLMTGAPMELFADPGQGVQSQQPTAAATILTEAEVTAAALEHAGVTEATGLTVRLDRDDRTDHWDVHWRTGDWEYDYDIHPQTGAVLEHDREYEPIRKDQPRPQPQTPPAEEAAPEPNQLTGEEALTIALAHAGLTKDQITLLECEPDRDDRRPEWEIEFWHEGWEYSYEIHAETGKILDWEREWDD